MGATSFFLFLAACSAGICTGDAGPGFTFKDIESIAKYLPTHSIAYREREIILIPRSDKASIISLILPPMTPPEVNVPDNGASTTEKIMELPQAEEISDEEEAARIFAMEYNRIMDKERAFMMEANWNYMSNMTAENVAKFNALIAKVGAARQEWMPKILSFNYTTYKDPLLRRQFKSFSSAGYSALPADKLQQLMKMIGIMSNNYGTVRICSYQDPTKCDLQLEPEITNILKHSNDPEEMKYYWKEWYDKAGTPMRPFFDEYVKLKNEAARLNNHTSAADEWIDNYEDPTFERQMEDIFYRIRPFFEELHAFVRHALSVKYGEDLVPNGEPIPMHLLGNIWAQHWAHVEDLTTPFPEVPLPDITAELQRQNYTVLDIYKMAEKFFTSMGLPEMPDEFWKNSIFEKPEGRDIVCQASAWDMNNGTDFRIKQCTRVNIQDMLTAHHEMGHIEYSMLYRQQPMVFRASANDGFHEAFGDTIALSVNTPKYWERVGLVDHFQMSNNTKINQLFRMALDKVPEIQFIYALEMFRYDVFRGHIEPEHYNCEYWENMLRLLGVKPPVQRYIEDFDPPAKYHIAADFEFARYIISTILQFQFHKALCIAAGEYEPGTPGKLLSDCSLYGSKAAGDILKKVLSLGSSVPWPDQLEMISGKRKLDASALIEYFQPLYLYLVKSNRENGVSIAWNVYSECLHRESNNTTNQAD